MRIQISDTGFSVYQRDVELLRHSEACPMVYLGVGTESVDMYRGNFNITDYVEERIALRKAEITGDASSLKAVFSERLELVLSCEEDLLQMRFRALDDRINRFWLRIPAAAEEKCYGCGEQMSYFNLRGRSYPLWTSEPGVGRDKSTYVTWRSDVENKAGGDYYNTNFPAPMYVSSKHYWLLANSTAYADFDFTHDDFHELQFWEVPEMIRIQTGDSYLEILRKLSSHMGRQPELPEWVYNGAILGLQGGSRRVDEIVRKSQEAGIAISGIWCQDWEGKRITSFGKRLQWDWIWNPEMYPQLPQRIKEYEADGKCFLGYINPYLVNDGKLYQEGFEKGYFATDRNGETYLVDFGEFYCGVVDLTNPDAYEWFKNIIKENLIGIGLAGWMADFGEYLPTDVKLFNGKDAMLAHNEWPVLWAKCNYDALAETDNLGKKFVFMRAGGAGTQKYCPVLWAGDQSVDFSIHDGLASVIVGALSAAMSGCGLHHSDIGGYTSLFENLRTKELFLRWAEMAAFTPVMRTHEGNRPDTNFQYYDDADCMAAFGRLTKIYKALSPYIRKTVKENAEEGIPVQRPLLLHYECDSRCETLQTEYLLGRDVLVAPVYLENVEKWNVYLPEDSWVHLWTGEEYSGGDICVDAPLGYPPVFYRKESEDAALFETIKKEF